MHTVHLPTKPILLILELAVHSQFRSPNPRRKIRAHPRGSTILAEGATVTYHFTIGSLRRQLGVTVSGSSSRRQLERLANTRTARMNTRDLLDVFPLESRSTHSANFMGFRYWSVGSRNGPNACPPMRLETHSTSNEKIYLRRIIARGKFSRRHRISSEMHRDARSVRTVLRTNARTNDLQNI